MIDVMKMALEAFEDLHEMDIVGIDYQQQMEKLRQAIEQAEKQEPVAQCTNSDTWNCKYCRKTETCEALKDSRNFGEPAKPEWVGLTDVERCTFVTWLHCQTINEIFNAIEAKLRERNT